MKYQLKQLLLFVLLILSFSSFSQNLVPNGDFEDYSSCPDDTGQIDELDYWFSPSTIVAGTPDFLHTCVTSSDLVSVPHNSFGYQSPQSGEGYTAIILYRPNTVVREYLSTELTETLEEDACYKFEMFVNISNSSQYAIDRIGVYFTSDEITGNTLLPLPFTPTIENTPGNIISDTMDWTSITGEFQADGTEQYLIIGNFQEDSILQAELSNTTAPYNHGYYNIDNVSLTKVECFTNNNNLLNSPIDISITPNPTTSQLNINIENQENSNTIQIKLFNSLGQLVLSSQQNGKDNYSWNIEDFPNGSYFLEINYLEERYIRKIIKTGY